MSRETDKPYPRGELVHKDLDNLIQLAYADAEQKYREQEEKYRVEIETASAKYKAKYNPTITDVITKLNAHLAQAQEIHDSEKEKNIQASIKALNKPDICSILDQLNSIINKQFTETEKTEFNTILAELSQLDKNYKELLSEKKRAKRNAESVTINNIAALSIIIHSDTAIPNKQFIIRYQNNSNQAIGFSYTNNPERRDRLMGSVGPMGDSTNLAFLYAHSETGISSFLLKGSFEDMKPALEEHKETAEKQGKEVCVTLFLNTFKDTCWVCERVIPKFALTISEKLEIPLSQINISIRYNEEYKGNRLSNQYLPYLRADKNILTKAENLLKKEAFDQLDEKTKIKVLNRIIEFAISHSSKKMTDFAKIEATAINDSLTQLTQENNEALAKDLKREILASKIKVDKKILEKTQETTIPSTPTKDQAPFTSRAFLNHTPDASLVGVCTPKSRVNTKRAQELASNTDSLTPTELFQGTPVKDILVTNEGVLEELYALSKDIEKEKIDSSAGRSKSPDAISESAAATGLRRREGIATAINTDAQGSPAASTRNTSPAAAISREQSATARSSNPSNNTQRRLAF
ncbi:MAG: hypothetical protein ISP24_02690 [Rickettsiales bacterium]|nr:hypothetical protein [Rickettsiales bacterium]